MIFTVWLGPLHPQCTFRWSFITFHHEIKLTTTTTTILILNTRRMFRMSCWTVLKLIWKFPKMHIWLLDNISIPVSSPRLVQPVGASTQWWRLESTVHWGRITKPYTEWFIHNDNMWTLLASRSDTKPSHPSQYADSEYCITIYRRGRGRYLKCLCVQCCNVCTAGSPQSV